MLSRQRAPRPRGDDACPPAHRAAPSLPFQTGLHTACDYLRSPPGLFPRLAPSTGSTHRVQCMAPGGSPSVRGFWLCPRPWYAGNGVAPGAVPMNACMTRRSTSTRAAIFSAFLRSNGTGDLPERGHMAFARLRSQACVERAPPKSPRRSTMDGTRRGKRCSHATVPLPLCPRRGHLFASTTRACRYGMRLEALIQQEVT